MALDARPALAAARERLARAAREHWPGLLVGLVIALGATGLWWMLRADEDELIDRMLELEGIQLQSVFERALERRGAEMVTLARQWETREAPDDTLWLAAVRDLADRDAVFRAFEWRNADLTPRWATPFTATLSGQDLDPQYEEPRRVALYNVAGYWNGHVSASFPGPRGRRQIVIAAPMLRDSALIGVQVGIVRVRDMVDSIIHSEARRGFSVSVTEGPYLVYGPLASREGPAEEALSRWVRVRVGDLSWTIDFWPGSELLDHLRSHGPPLVLLLGLAAAVGAAAGVRSLQLLRRRARAGRARPPDRAGLDPPSAGAGVGSGPSGP